MLTSHDDLHDPTALIADCLTLWRSQSGVEVVRFGPSLHVSASSRRRMWSLVGLVGDAMAALEGGWSKFESSSVLSNPALAGLSHPLSTCSSARFKHVTSANQIAAGHLAAVCFVWLEILDPG